METMRHIILQEMNEERFNRKHIDTKIKKAIQDNASMMDKVYLGVALVNSYMQGSYYDSKMKRIEQLKDLDLEVLVTDMFIGIAYCQRPELFTSVSAQLASRLKFSDKAESITTVAELLAVLCQTDAFDIDKVNKQASLMVVSRIPLPENLLHFIEHSQYLPPMVCEPLELTHNFSSGYLTHNDSLILGAGNHHDGDVCLDVLNTMNKVALKLDLQFLCIAEEEQTADLMDKDEYLIWATRKSMFGVFPTYNDYVQHAQEQWEHFKKQSYFVYSLMEQQGNRFYLTHKVDKRGRIYACGYHINTQGAPFKKAMLEFADPELVEGAPQ